MSKKNQATAASKTNTTAVERNADRNGENRSQAIRDYVAANPNAKPSEIVTGLKAQGITVTPSLVSSVLRRGGERIDVQSIKATAEFIKGFKGGIPEAKTAIETVGGFVEKCGSASSALASLDAYEALAVVLK